MPIPGMRPKIAPSILSADFAELAAAVARVAPVVDLVHVDVMDGHFVPNLTIGPPVVRSLRPHTDLYLDCHLMIDNPGDLIEDFAEAGADSCTVHVELDGTEAVIAEMRRLGLGVGVVVNPETPFEAAEPYLHLADLFLVMSVHPGFGGQAFIPEVLDKVRAGRRYIDERGLACEIEIDGGINRETIGVAAAAGADVFVAGSAVFGAPDPRAAAEELHRLAADSLAPAR
jgi:ribulose-phosphate 3-epimerase